MKKIIPILLICLLVLPSILALSIDVEKISKNEIMILGLNEPAHFDLTLKNHGPEDNLIFYTYFSPNIFPKGTIHIDEGETKNVSIEIYPPESINQGYSQFQIFIRGQDDSEIIKSLKVNVIKLENVFEIGSEQIDAESEEINIYIQNKVNFEFKDLNVELSSPFFKENQEFSLMPYERKNLTINLDKEKFNKLEAGYYTMTADVKIKDLTTTVEGRINFAEKNILTTKKKEYGIIVNTQIINKINQGNILETVETTIKKNIISRLFTTFNPEPDYIERQGGFVYYTWEDTLEPGSSVEIKVRTNWLFPLIIIILIVLIVVLLKKTSKTNMILRKRVSFVRSKGGEFALKVSIIVKAKKYLERVTIIDRLPPLVKVHERFGSEKPTRVDEKNKKLEWQYEKLEEGEVRILTYIIFSKIGLLGKFALPRTNAIFEREGVVKEVSSNRTFFLAEAARKEKDEYANEQ
jgi:ribosomal protein L17